MDSSAIFTLVNYKFQPSNEAKCSKFAPKSQMFGQFYTQIRPKQTLKCLKMALKWLINSIFDHIGPISFTLLISFSKILYFNTYLVQKKTDGEFLVIFPRFCDFSRFCTGTASLLCKPCYLRSILVTMEIKSVLTIFEVNL